jgi:hypothetical protein
MRTGIRFGATLVVALLTSQAFALPSYDRLQVNAFIFKTQSSPQQLEQRLRKVIGELQAGQPDLNDMEPLLRISVQQQLSNVVSRLQSLGRLTAVQYVGPQNNAEVFQVQFQQGATAWMIQVAPNGKLSVLWFN